MLENNFSSTDTKVYTSNNITFILEKSEFVEINFKS